MKKNNSTIIGIILFLIAIIAIGFLLFKYKYQVKNVNEDSKSNAPENTTSASPSASSSKTTSPTPSQSTSTLSAQDTISKFLNIIAEQSDKSSVANYTTADFNKSDFVSGIVSKKSLPMSFYQILGTDSKNATSWSFQVKEEYDNDKTNNAGVNGISIYTLKLQNGKWLVSGRAE